MSNKLTNLIINRTDLVDSPSNPLARVVLFKRDLSTKEKNELPDSAFAYISPDGERHLPIHDKSHTQNALARLNQTNIPASAKAAAKRKILAAAKKFDVKVFKNLYSPTTTDGVLARKEFWDRYYELMDAFRTSVDGLLYNSELDDKKRVAMLVESTGEVSDALTELFENYPVEKSQDENDEIYETFEKTVDVLQELDTLLTSGEISVEEIADILGGLEMPENTKELEKAKADLDTKTTELTKAMEKITKLEGDVEKLTKAAEEVAKAKAAEPEDIWKGVNPKVKEEFEALRKRSEDSEKTAKAAEESAAVVKLSKRVADELGGIVGTVDEKSAMLRDVEKLLGSEKFEKLYTVLKTASEFIKKSVLFEERGTNGASGAGNTAFEKIKAKATELMKGDAKLSEAEAIAKATTANPDLYKEYITEGVN